MPTDEVMDFGGYSSKLSPATKRVLGQTPTDGSPVSSFLISIDGGLNEDRRSQLKPLVIEIRSVAGDVVAVTAHLEAVPELAALEFVRYIEIADLLYLEATPSVP